MSTLADQYYIKALDQYPFNLEESIESLNYALSHNNEHVGANYLMGKLYKEQLNNFVKAEEYFSAALAYNPNDINTCTDYILLLITVKELDKAEKLILYAQKLRGIDMAMILSFKGLIHEYKHQYSKALSFYKKAIFEAYNEDCINQLNNDIKRIKNKKKLKNKAKDSKNNRKKAS